MRKAIINLQVVFRVLIGLLLFVSGGEKILSHYQNFLYVIQGYDFLPMALERLVALTVPWAEFVVSIFLILGLWLPFALRAAFILFASFILVVSQAIIRGLPLDECGCFGQLISLPPQFVLMMDSCVFMLIIYLILKIEKTQEFSLDKYLSS